jgi:hypothetical protein
VLFEWQIQFLIFAFNNIIFSFLHNNPKTWFWPAGEWWPYCTPHRPQSRGANLLLSWGHCCGSSSKAALCRPSKHPSSNVSSRRLQSWSEHCQALPPPSQSVWAPLQSTNCHSCWSYQTLLSAMQQVWNIPVVISSWASAQCRFARRSTTWSQLKMLVFLFSVCDFAQSWFYTFNIVSKLIYF